MRGTNRKVPLEVQERRRDLLLTMPLTIFLFLFFIAPFAFIILYAVGFYNPYGQATGEISLRNFAALWIGATGSLFLRTFAVAGSVTALCFLLGYPVAYYISEQPPRKRNLLVMLLMVPFWTSFLLRTYSLMMIFRLNGLANQFLIYIGLASGPIFEIGNFQSVVWAETYAFLPFMVLPLYATLERLSRSFVEASYILGAGRTRTFLRVVLPLSAPGILAGSLLVFIIAMGELVIPFLVGGIEAQYLLGNSIDLRAVKTPGTASALSLMFMVIVLGISLLYVRFGGREGLRL